MARDGMKIRWRGMIRRCYDPSYIRYHRYGGRGIKVCKAWLDDIEQFRNDMGEPPTSGHQIDRIDNDGNYEPSNCRWATRSVNGHNKPPSRASKHYRGVSPRKTSFQASIRADTRKLCIGSYMTETEAAWMYDQYALALYHDAAYTNFKYIEIKAQV